MATVFEDVIKRLEDDLAVLRAQLEDSIPLAQKAAPKAVWTRNIIDLAEKILAEYELATTRVDGRPATWEFLAEQAANMYSNVSVKSLTGLIRKLIIRKSGPTVFHEEAVASLIARRDRSLEGKTRRKRA